ncbi:uncharacterized protein CTRU02_211971 [Colletotrichum truncatum]|uniref:Uncharacterized protein n=1 Tax=Colletotrichum truncatum TaxID=5467 RepID=A0ACC3YM94_COLTU
MPDFRGLNVSVVLGPRERPLPELPHPESSSVRLCGPRPYSLKSSPSSSLQSTPEKCKPTTSVYIPSSPGAQFHIRYAINKPQCNAEYMYFNMEMNGRAVASWGTKSQNVPSQVVSHALYEPDNKWHYRESGMTFKREGVEKRYFYFTPRFEETSAAMDGGLIELQVFRSTGRRKRSIELTGFRSQNAYGITFPTGGLMESPQDLTYYNWLLIDSINSPYATFRFFYRNWIHLKALNLVPETYCNELGDASRIKEKTPQNNPKMPVDEMFNNMAPFNFESDAGSVFEGNIKMYHSEREGLVHYNHGPYRIAMPPRTIPPPATRSILPKPSKLARNKKQDLHPRRPLPVLPATVPSRRSSSLEFARAPSVTPSLLQYVDESGSADEIELGVAKKVLLPSIFMKLSGNDTPTYSSSVSPTKPPLSLDCNRMSPSLHDSDALGNFGQDCPSITGIQIERQFTEYTDMKFSTNTSGHEMTKFPNSLNNSSILEAEWFRRKPSPLRWGQRRGNMNKRSFQTSGGWFGTLPED